MRNKLIHEYFGRNIGLVWRVANADVPALVVSLDKLRG